MTDDPGAAPGRPLRILVVNWQDRENPQSGGAEIHLHETFGRLADQGHDVTLLCSGWAGCDPRASLDGIDVHRVGRRYTFPVHARGYFRRHLETRPLDVIVEDLNKVPLFTPRWSDVPVVALVHHLFGATAFHEANPFLAGATWLLERPIPRVFRECPTVAVSRSTADDLERRGLSPDRITVIPNGIDLERFRPPADGERTDDPTALFLGRIRKYKRVDLAVRAVARLRDRGMELRLRVVGKGGHQSALERLVRELELNDRVAFPGFVSEEEKVELLQRSWMHVLPSAKEGWGISNLEAAACGTPSVASDSPGLRESVVHGETGFLVPHGDVEALADAMGRLIAHPDRRDTLGRQARTFAEGFSWETTAARMLEVLRRAAAGSGAG